MKEHSNLGNRIYLLNLSEPLNERFAKEGTKLLKKYGFMVELSPNIYTKDIFAGSLEERLDLFHKAMVNNEYNIVLLTTGGFGSFELLDKINFNLVKQGKKLIVGMSGNSILLNAITKKTKLITFLNTNLDGLIFDKTGKTFKNFIAFFKENSKRIISNFKIINKKDTNSISGIAIGGTLRAIESLIGTPYEPEWQDKILFIEETGRGAGDFIRAYYHLKYCGVLRKIKALVIGHINAELKKDKMDYFYNLLKKEDNLCVIKTEEFGHNCSNTVIPIGGNVTIDLINKKIFWNIHFTRTPIFSSKSKFLTDLKIFG